MTALPRSRGMSPLWRGLAAAGGASPVLAALANAAEVETPAAVGAQVDTALRSVLLVGAVLVVLILAAVAVIIYRKAFGSAPADTPVAAPADPLAEAANEEKRGNLVAAAQRYEAAGDKLKAAACWESVKDLARAAECFEAGGELERAAQLHVRSGGALRAAGIYMRTKNYIEAAKIFRNKGDHLRAAQALELFGNKLAAAREYSAAGNHARAARLLEEERMYAEAAEAYRPLLGGVDVTPANADRYSTYAALLGLAGDKERAGMTYRRVLVAVPGHLRALAAVQALQPRMAVPGTEAAAAAPAAASPAAPTPVRIGAEDVEPELWEPEASPAEPSTLTAPVLPTPTPEELGREIEIEPEGERGSPLHRVFTLRSMIHAGRMEPRYSMRLWVQVMRTLAERHGAAVFGCLDPESIVIDMENNVSIQPQARCAPEYRAPEVRAGRPPDRQADIYSLGIILYELVTGSLENLGKKRAGELFKDVPPWLDELIRNCTEPDLSKRFRSSEEVSAALVKLKNTGQE